MGLDAISKDTYSEFAIRQFAMFDKILNADVVEQVYQRFNGVTAYLQRVMNVLFMNTPKGEHCAKNLKSVRLMPVG